MNRRALLSACLLFAALFLSGKSGAARLCLEEGITRVESQAFAGTGFESAFIPESVSYIAPDAFDGTLGFVAGFKGSAAESYALAAGKTFIDAGIYGISADAPLYVSPSVPFSVSADFECALDTETEYIFTRGDDIVLRGSGSGFRLAGSGVYSLTVRVKNEYTEKTVTFKEAVTVGLRAGLTSENPILPVGQSVCLVCPGEKRDVKFTVPSGSALRVDSHCVTALAPGQWTLNVRLYDEVNYISYPITVTAYIPVSEISYDALPAIYPGERFSLNGRAFPENAAYPGITYTSSNPAAVTVDERGVLVYAGPGDTVITLSTRDKTERFALRACAVPEGVCFEPEGVTLGTGGRLTLSPVYLPAGSLGRNEEWTSGDTGIAYVSSDGTVTGVSPGVTEIVCVCGELTARVEVTVKTAPETLSFTSGFSYLYPGESGYPETAALPADCELNRITYLSSNPEVCAVSEDGRLTAGVPGECVITARTQNGIEKTLPMRVLPYPGEIGVSLGRDKLYLEIGKAFTLSPLIYPSEARGALLWESSDEGVAAVSPEGEVTALGSGRADIRVSLESGASASVSVIVPGSGRTLVMPLRTTGVYAITENLRRIERVKLAAFDYLDELRARGVITDEILAARRALLTDAFAQYSFVWMTEAEKEYWRAENSEGGVKNFRPGVVYYGLPYISGEYLRNRWYTAQTALRDGWYTDAGDYALMNTDKPLYAGCDCSSFVGQCYYKNASCYAGINTAYLGGSADFRTLSLDAVLQPGDIIVKKYRHVVFFLYYANDAHTQAVILEQGGDEFGINTVSASVVPLSRYYDEGYVPRRLNKWYTAS